MVEQRFQIKQHSGPLPAPEALLEYDRIVPGAAERILHMAEKQQSHRHEQEKLDLNEGVKYARRGQWMAFTITTAAFVVGTYLAFTGHPTVASILFGGVLVGIVVAFLGSRKTSKEEEERSH